MFHLHDENRAKIINHDEETRILRN